MEDKQIIEKITEKVQELFLAGMIKGFVGLKKTGDHIGPHLFTGPDELEALSLGDRLQPGDARYPLAGIVSCLLEAEPHNRYAVLVRGCDEQALIELQRETRVTPLSSRRIIPLGFACPSELAAACQCAKPTPATLVAGEPTPGVDLPSDEFTGQDIFEQLEFWYQTFDRCIKCFGCRNVCPVCACKECTIERELMVPQKELPPEPTFLMTRAVHMVDRCVYCGLCELACPADIPLKALYRFAARLVGQGHLLPTVREFKPNMNQTWPFFIPRLG